MINEVFAKPCVGAMIVKTVENEEYILIQTRQKEGGNETNGMIEIPAGKIREYEDVFTTLRREVRSVEDIKNAFNKLPEKRKRGRPKKAS